MIKTQSAKSKGRKLQQTVAEMIRRTFPRLTIRDVHSTSMGKGGSDVELSQSAFEYFPYDVECKAKSSFAVYGDYEQAKSHGDGEPLLVIKGDRKRPLAIIDLEHFFNLIERCNNAPDKDL